MTKVPNYSMVRRFRVQKPDPKGWLASNQETGTNGENEAKRGWVGATSEGRKEKGAVVRWEHRTNLKIDKGLLQWTLHCSFEIAANSAFKSHC